MAATININGVATRAVIVPYGSTVTLLNATPTGSAQKWELIDYPTDIDDANPDFATNFSAWTAVGDGTYKIDQPSSPFAAVTFRPDVTGTYLIRLTSTEGGVFPTQTAVVRVAEVHSGEHLQGAGETVEGDSRVGYKKIANIRMKHLARRMQGYVRVVNVSGSSIARGKVVRLSGTQDAHTVSPNSDPGGTASAKKEKVYKVTVADNTAADASVADYAVLDDALANNGFGWAQKFGLFEGKSDINYATFAAGSWVYFNSIGDQVASPPATGVALPVGVLLENGSSGALSVALAGVRGPSNVADWSLWRYFLLDGDGGDDVNNVGYVDAAAGATIAPAGKAIKTFQRLFQILPASGAGRRFKILVKNRAGGATYVEQDGSTPADVDLTRLSGYSQIMIWGSTDLTNSATDRILAGAIQAQAGPGGGGAWTVTTGGTSQVFSVASGSLNAEPSLEGCRVRWLTGALAGQCQMIAANSSTQITVGTPFTGAPTNGDTFVLEKAGVRVNTLKINASATGRNRPTVAVGIDAVADAASAMLITGGGHFEGALLQTSGATAGTEQLEISEARFVNVARTVRDEAGASVSVGSGCRMLGSYRVTDCNVVILNDYGHVEVTGNANPQIDRVLYGQIGSGVSFMGLSPGRLFVNACGAVAPYGVPSGGSPGPVQFTIGSGVSATVRTRQQGGMRLTNCGGIEVSGVDFTNCVTVACVANFGNFHTFKMDNCTGSSGNTGSGISLPPEAGGTAILGIEAANTVTGSNGDVVLHETFGSNHWISWASLAKVGSFTTSTGLRVQSLNTGNVSLQGPVSVVLSNQSGGAIAVGEIVRTNGTAGQATSAQADSAGGATGVLGAALTNPASGDNFLVGTDGVMMVQFSSAPTVGLMAYLDPDTARQAKTFTSSTGPTVGSGRQKLRLGYVIATASGNIGFVAWSPDKIPVAADGGV